MKTLDELRRERAKISFDLRYHDQGGFERFLAMMEAGATTTEIARHFGISRQYVSNLIQTFVGERYTEFLIKRALPYGQRKKPNEG